MIFLSLYLVIHVFGFGNIDSVFALFPLNNNFLQVDLAIDSEWSQTWAKNQSGAKYSRLERRGGYWTSGIPGVVFSSPLSPVLRQN